MQPKNTKIALILGALFLGASGASNAATETFTITVGTLDDVELHQDTPLDFGSNIYTAAGGECVMDASDPGNVLLNAADTAADAQDGDYGQIEGTGCLTSDATPGAYRITGAGGSTVVVTLSSVDATDWTFTPDVNAFANHDGLANGDTVVSMSVGTPTPLDLANSTDATTATSGAAVDGSLSFVLGGTLNIVNELTQSTPYDSTFQVTVVYN